LYAYIINYNAGDYNLDKIYLIIYVDDGLILASSKEALNVVLNHLQSGIRITISDAKEYIGIEIIQDRSKDNIHSSNVM